MRNIILPKYTIRMDNWLQSNLDIVKNEAIPNKWDALFIIFGREGSGKSTLASQLAYYLDHNFDVDNIAFVPNEFHEACDDLPKESSIIWDEAITGANAQMYDIEVSQTIITRLTQIRKKRLKIIICFPYLYMLNKYFVSRCIASIFVYAKSFSDRGHALFYSGSKTEYLYELMKYKYKYHYKKALSVAKKSFYFEYPSTFCADVEAYENKKDESIMNYRGEGVNLWKERTVKILKYLKSSKSATLKQISEKTNIPLQTLYNLKT